jgi:hypothetical protein
VDAIWLSPIFPSPMADFGYDVSDYTGIDPIFGSRADFDELLRQAHRRGLKIILDFVPNHSSDQHPWFLESRSSRSNPKRDWYIWADARPDGSLPNNWLSVFGGPAWEWDERTGQYYLHSFLKEQPDLNWRNPEVKAAIEQGMADAWADLAKFQKEQIDTGKVTSGDLFGTRSYLKNNYLYRMTAAVIGIYGNSKQEAMYPIYAVDSDRQKLEGSKRYTVRFAPGQLPPANAFWSMTMYELPSSLLVANPLNRYLLNKPMLPQLKKDADGGYTFYIQNASPGADKEANWLPAPKGPFMVIMRLYWPKPVALDGKWKQPPMVASK